MITATHKISFQPGRKSKKLISNNVDVLPLPQGRLPRITKMMALAIRFDHLINTGQVTDQAELARVGHVSRARLTQIMDLNLLAPEIQEEILDLPLVQGGNDKILERDLRPIAQNFLWSKQKSIWKRLIFHTPR